MMHLLNTQSQIYFPSLSNFCGHGLTVEAAHSRFLNLSYQSSTRTNITSSASQHSRPTFNQALDLLPLSDLAPGKVDYLILMVL
jgi:hypothetical protein